ncbi:MAG: flagellar motor switch protein FliM, partial [Steroidobacteraceae bacterium]
MSGQKQLLSSDEIDALVEGMQRGDVDTSAAQGDADTAVKPYSLVATDTVSRGQLAALEMINDRFARQLRT